MMELLLAEVSRNNDSIKGLIILLLVMLPFVVVMCLIVVAIRKKVTKPEESLAASAAFTLHDIRQLYADGAISEEEFETLKARVSAKTVQNMQLNEEEEEADAGSESKEESSAESESIDEDSLPEIPVVDEPEAMATSDAKGASSEASFKPGGLPEVQEQHQTEADTDTSSDAEPDTNGTLEESSDAGHPSSEVPSSEEDDTGDDRFKPQF